MKISIIIPTLNEATNIVASLSALQALRQQGHEVIIADGGSRDHTITLARPMADHIITVPPGRGRQMNAGASKASGDILLFLHADTLLPDNSATLIKEALEKNTWGRFDIQLSGSHPLLRMVEFMMNWRSRLTGIATGDQAIFVRRELFETVKGFPEIPLMEDIAFCKQIKQHGKPACINRKLITSSRRWEINGILHTIILMWRLRLAYFLGANPEALARRYQ